MGVILAFATPLIFGFVQIGSHLVLVVEEVEAARMLLVEGKLKELAVA